jgi:serine/threonine-protein kinase
MRRLAGVEQRDAGQVGGRYRLIEKLGTGGMSVVWSGYDEILGRPVAVKVLSAQLADDRTFRERLRQEALAAAQLCHPHITGIFDYGESPVVTAEGDAADVVVPYVVMELNDGESVSDRLTRRGPLPWREAVTVAAEVASALATAHARGVVHRDVTPANVMLTGAGAKVVDFGISALIGQRDAAPDGTLLGTPAYLAPERLAGGQVSPATDVYALGLLLYRSLTGRLPWPAENTTEALRAHLYADPEPIPSQIGMPAVVADMCLSCLAKDPADRPGAAAVAHALSPVVGVQAIIPPVRVVERRRSRFAVAVRSGRSLAGLLGDDWSGVLRRLLRAGHRRVHAAAATITLLAVLGVTWASSQEPGEVGTAQAAAVGSGSAVQHPTRCRVRYQVRRDSGTTFDVSLAITVVGQRPADAWRLEFAYPGNQRLTSLSGPVAQLEQLGKQVTVRPTDGTELRPGKTIQIFLHGAYEQVNPLPLAFLLDGRECVVMVLGTAVTPPGTPDTGVAEETTQIRAASSAGAAGTPSRGNRGGRGSHKAAEATDAGAAGRKAGPGTRDAAKTKTVPRTRNPRDAPDRTTPERSGGPRRGGGGFSVTNPGRIGPTAI